MNNDIPKVKKLEFYAPNMFVNMALDVREIAKLNNNLSVIDIIASRIEAVREDFLKEIQEGLKRQHPDASSEVLNSAYNYMASTMSVKVDDSNLFKPVELWEVQLDNMERSICFNNTDDLAHMLRREKLILVEDKNSSSDIITDIFGEVKGKLEHHYFIRNIVEFSTEYHQNNYYYATIAE